MNMNKKLGLVVALFAFTVFLIPSTAKASPASGLDNLVASTYLGGSEDDLSIASMAVSPTGSVYVIGQTYSTNFPTTTGAYQTSTGGGSDAFVAKFNAGLTLLEASTYLGGSSTEIPYGIVLDSSGNVFVTGRTASASFPTTTGCYQANLVTSDDAFVVKFNADLTLLLASTFLGGTGSDKGWRIALDPTESFVYVAGRTAAANFPTTTGAFQANSGGGNDIFVAKLNVALTTLSASTYLGGSGSDMGVGIAVDATGSIFVAGYTASANFPTTTGAYQTSLAGGSGNDVFITKLSSGLTSTLAATYLGGTGTDGAYAVSLDNSGNVYVSGQSDSINFPTTTGAYQGTNAGAGGAYDGFVAKLDNNLISLIAATYIGGSNSSGLGDIAYFSLADSFGNIYAVGSSPSSDFPTTTGAYQTTYGGGAGDAILMKFNSNLTQLLGSTYVGGSGNDQGNFLALDSVGNIYIVGYTTSTNFPTTTGAYQGTYGGAGVGAAGAGDVFIAKFGNPVPTITSLSPSLVYNDHGAFTLTVEGTGFNTSSVVNYAGTAKTTTFVSSTQITASILSTDLGTDGRSVKAVTVTNGAPGGGTSASSDFTVVLRVGSSASAPSSGGTVSTPAPVTTPVVTTPVVTTPVVNPTNIIESPVTTPVVETPAPVVVSYVFKKDLRSGQTNSDIKKLQVFLNTHGFTVAKKGAGSPGKETTYFGAATRSAIMKFQKANKIKPVNGLFGPLTRGKINSM